MFSLPRQLAWPALNFDIPWLTFSRLRPLHTNAVIFAFGGCALFATSYYIVQRTCKTRLFAPYLAWFTFWGWQAVIVAAVITLPLGLTSSKEYAELEWLIDVLIALVWISYAIVFFGTLIKRKTSHIYVANWFFAAFIITIALLHIVNSMAIPVSAFKSYSLFGGATDAMVQWWYGHNAVGFYLTAAFLGMMYYFVPVQIGRSLLLSSVYRAFLGVDCFIYVGRWSPFALLSATRLDTVASYGVLYHPIRTILGRYD